MAQTAATAHQEDTGDSISRVWSLGEGHRKVTDLHPTSSCKGSFGIPTPQGSEVTGSICQSWPGESQALCSAAQNTHLQVMETLESPRASTSPKDEAFYQTRWAACFDLLS